MRVAMCWRKRAVRCPVVGRLIEFVLRHADLHPARVVVVGGVQLQAQEIHLLAGWSGPNTFVGRLTVKPKQVSEKCNEELLSLLACLRRIGKDEEIVNVDDSCDDAACSEHALPGLPV